MGSVSKASWMVVLSVGAVEALKDQVGLCRWNYALRSLQQHAKNNLGSLSQTRRMNSSVDVSRKNEADHEKMKRTEETLRKLFKEYVLLQISFQSSRKYIFKVHMASPSKASLIVAVSVAAVEALKDQGGLCRWNYALRSLHQRGKNSMGSFSQTRRMSSSTCMDTRKTEEVDKAKKSEQSLRKVMYLSCWGPY
ncbi:hypothetical protein J5N97_011942 [Dioscorea zingiberensis]|uniref:Wound-responsive family protein n=1 Tax=Dioscorea zingiberensis TaxID=325984 RepID=A0A9D5HP17_9LILI|nr:hypothetical protein J5N97_011898 [Dioscorea zingiberensis]KAJ0983687.1 hypothetical protein J5N97_011942 [Dioscorea zingiberensis]